MRRRWPWVLCGAVSMLAAVGLVVWLVGVLRDFFQQPLAEQNSHAGVVSMFVGVAGLVVAVAGLVVAVLQVRRGVSSTAGPPARQARSQRRAGAEQTPGAPALGGSVFHVQAAGDAYTAHQQTFHQYPEDDRGLGKG